MLTHKSQEERAPKCRKCYVDMQKHMVLDLGITVFGVTEKGQKLKSENYDWICQKCGLRWEVRPNKKKDVSP